MDTITPAVVTTSSDAGEVPPVAQVGGKARSLLLMARAGLPVPALAALPVSFFEPWSAAVGDGTALEDLEPTPGQRDALERALAALPSGSLMAVRSSAPDEDGSGASFAGGYASVLGVRADGLAEAVATCFASAFDERVATYRRQQGLDASRPRIAVVVQQQVAADVAGVAFSLDPSTNDLDHVVIDANAGLGESVVSGSVTPDHVVLDTVTGELDYTVGSKQESVWLLPDGGTETREEPPGLRRCLTEDQVRRVADLVRQAESLNGHPVDTEWAIAGGDLFLLQSRPVTAYVPLVPAMTTEPGARRTMWWDLALTEGITTNAPMRPLTLDWLFRSLEVVAAPMFGRVRLPSDAEPSSSLIFAAGGRYWGNLSMMLSVLPVSIFARQFAAVDGLLGQVVASVDRERYRSAPLLRSVRWSVRVPQLARAAWAGRRFAATTVRAVVAPVRFQVEYDRVIAEVEAALRGPVDADESPGDLLVRHGALMGRAWAEASVPALISYFLADGRIGTIAARYVERTGDERAAELLDAARTGLPGNVAVQIGVALHGLSRLLPDAPQDGHDADALAERVRRREMPDDFTAAWDDFVAGFGARGPGELMLSRERYGEDPSLAMEQVVAMAGGLDPSARQREHADAGKEAYRELVALLDGRERARFVRAYARVARWAGTRDTPKQTMVLGNWAFRRQALAAGQRLVDAGCLDDAQDALWFTVAELDATLAGAGTDLRALRAGRTGYYDRLAGVRAFPHLIDSRGRIPTAPSTAGEDDPSVLTGTGISRGTAVGRVKVLATPREKKIEPGDVLVAYTTDPGWTPLFAAAEAVVLEVGGVLQHGGVVAREYGLPCVAGIRGVTVDLRDGQLVEVDGAAGTVRLLDEGAQPAAAGA